MMGARVTLGGGGGGGGGGGLGSIVFLFFLVFVLLLIVLSCLLHDSCVCFIVSFLLSLSLVSLIRCY